MHRLYSELMSYQISGSNIIAFPEISGDTKFPENLQPYVQLSAACAPAVWIGHRGDCNRNRITHDGLNSASIVSASPIFRKCPQLLRVWGGTFAK